MKKALNLILLLALPLFIFAQRYTIKGTIEDAQSGEKLLYTNVYDALSIKGTTSNYYGFYSLSLPEGNVKLVFSYLGYKADTVVFILTHDTTINKSISQITEIEEVVITGTHVDKVASTQMGQLSIPIMQSKQLPVLLGETDLMKTIQLLPGVKGGTEGTSGIYVRGGGPDQNLILLDGVPVYNVNHLFGFMSVFNLDAIQSFTLLKGGFPARYGGRLSSVIDIKMKEGNNKEFHGEGSIGLISSKLSLEGPIIKDKTSFIVSGRRTYFDVLTWPLIYAATDGEGVGGYFFHDINAKVNHKFNDQSHIYYSFYNGLDKFYFKNAFSDNFDDIDRKENAAMGWGNTIHALRFNHILSNTLFANVTATYSDYKFFTGMESSTIYPDNKKDLFSFEYISGIKDWGLKADFDYIPNSNHYIKAGAGYIYHTFNPGVNVFKAKDTVTFQNQSQSTQIDTSFGNRNIYAGEQTLYLEDDINITEKLKVNLGVHFSMFNVKGEQYHSFQPRISTRYLINDDLSVKASYVEMMQYIHLLTNSTLGLPTDLWVPATKNINPQSARQYATGVEYRINDQFNFSAEVYYKTLYDLVEYKEGASFFSINDDWQQKIEQGKGWSKGIELLLQKTSGKTTGWIGYTLSKTDRQFAEISFGQIFPFKYDRRHDIAIAVVHNFSEKFDVGATWVYGTGSALTLSEEKYAPFNPGVSNSSHLSKVEYFKSRNSYRMPNYHRLDLAFNFHKKKKWIKSSWSFGAYNAYNKLNPFYIDYEYKYNKKKLMGYSLMPIIPYFRWNFSF